MKKFYKIVLAIIVIMTIGTIWFWPLPKALYSIAFSYVASPDYTYIEKQLWQYEEGYKIGEGDFVEFDNIYYRLHKDTIIKRDTPVAIIIRANNYLNTITVRSIKTLETGTYVDINKEQ